MNTSCCSESSDCANSSPACLAYESCLGACKGEAQCRAQCTYDNRVSPENAGPISALHACLVTHCETECGLQCGGVADYVAPPADAVACDQCVQGNACTVGTACGKSPDCDAYVRCILARRALDGHEACATEHPGGAALFGDPAGFMGPIAADTFASTYAGTCSAACNYGGNWSCVGHVVWPQPQATTTTITLQGVHDPLGPPIAGATVAICLDSDTDCTNPLGSGITDDAGGVSVAVPTIQGNQNRPQGATVFAKVTATGRLPAYEYSVAPLGWAAFTATPGDSAFLVTPSEVTSKGQDPSLGALYVAPADCLGSIAPAVRLTANDAGTPLYGNGKGSNTNVASESAGPAFFLNLPEGPVQVTATPLALGDASATATVYVHAGAFTEFGLPPTPLGP
jgi:hypothetical protein